MHHLSPLHNHQIKNSNTIVPWSTIRKKLVVPPWLSTVCHCWSKTTVTESNTNRSISAPTTTIKSFNIYHIVSKKTAKVKVLHTAGQLANTDHNTYFFFFLGGGMQVRYNCQSRNIRRKTCVKPVLHGMKFCFTNLVRGVRRTWKKVCQTKFVLNWANFYFANLVDTVRRTVTKLCLGSNTLRLTCSRNYSSRLTNLASDWLKSDSSPMEEEKTGTATHGWWRECFQPLALEEMASFVDLWEGQRYL